jgi:Chlorophyll A-B binding protein
VDSRAALSKSYLDSLNEYSAFQKAQREREDMFATVEVNGAPPASEKVNGAYLDGEAIHGSHLNGETSNDSHLYGEAINGAYPNGASIKVTYPNGVAINGEVRNGAHQNGDATNGESPINGEAINGESVHSAHLNGNAINGESINGASINGVSISVVQPSGASSAPTDLEESLIWWLPKFDTPPAKANLPPLNGWVVDPEEPLYGLPGTIGPLGFYDPLDFTSTAYLSDTKRLREAEVIHARVAMLAFLGFVVGESIEGIFKLTGPAIYQMDQIPDSVFNFFMVCVAAAEFYRMKLGWVPPNFLDGNTLFSLRDEYYPGDLGFDPFGLKPSTPEDFEVMQCRELNNGRLAMIGVAIMCLEEGLTGSPIFDQLIPPVCT